MLTVIAGFLTEQGPFRPSVDLTLEANPYAWNTVSNMVFIESPAGVGFSYTDDSDDLSIGDVQTAVDNYHLIQAFLSRFPDLRANALYITSESYGGHYMPTLAKQIVESNQVADSAQVINFKGFAVGNPYTDVNSGIPSGIATAWGHQLLPRSVYEEYVKTCKTPSAECTTLIGRLLGGLGDLNPYALDYPICTKSSHYSTQSLWLMNHQLLSAGLHPRAAGVRSMEAYEPCVANYMTAYLNQAAVKHALHVRDDLHWSECSSVLRYNHTDGMKVSTAPLYNQLIDGGHGLNILVYSGDDDAVCSTLGTQEWIWGLGYTPAANAWATYTVDGQTAGYLTKWTGTKLAFLTIHGAGHEVPTYKPEIALDMWERYLAGEFTDM